MEKYSVFAYTNTVRPTKAAQTTRFYMGFHISMRSADGAGSSTYIASMDVEGSVEL